VDDRARAKENCPTFLDFCAYKLKKKIAINQLHVISNTQYLFLFFYYQFFFVDIFALSIILFLPDAYHTLHVGTIHALWLRFCTTHAIIYLRLIAYSRLEQY